MREGVGVTWLTGVLFWIAVYVAVELLGGAFFELVLAPLLSPLRVLYRPPYGGLVLAATWLLALGVTVVGFASIETALGAAGFLVAIPVAVLATYTRRHELRERERELFLPDRSRDL